MGGDWDERKIGASLQKWALARSFGRADAYDGPINGIKEVSAMSSLVSSGYALVIVLFILLIIVGCVCVAW